MNTILEYAKTQNYPEIVLGVFSENLGGQKFYARQGFEKIGEYYFAVGDHRDHEFILRRSV
jgi:ribosomal protein S18 acetylase RimI-like enzyme